MPSCPEFNLYSTANIIRCITPNSLPSFLWHYILNSHIPWTLITKFWFYPFKQSNSIHVKLERVFPSTIRPQFYKITLSMHKLTIRSLNATTPDANQSKNASTVALLGGYSSLSSGSINQNPKLCTNQWTAWRHMHTRQAVSGQNLENAKITPLTWISRSQTRILDDSLTQKLFASSLALPHYLHPQFSQLYVPNHWNSAA